MKIAALMCAVLLLGGCIADKVDGTGPEASSPTSTGPSTSSRRSKDPDEPRQMCQDSSIAGESRTVCY